MSVRFFVFALIGVAASSSAADVSLPLEASASTPWEDLALTLSSEDVLSGPSDWNVWAEQCLDPFKLIGSSSSGPAGYDGTFAILSNYYLLNATSGLCLDSASCVFQNCLWPTKQGRANFPLFPPETSPFAVDSDFDTQAFLDEINKEEVKPLHNMPARVLHPRTVADIVQAVRFARTHRVGITVKVNGHSYFGSSSARNTLLVKMSTHYPKYDELGSMMECSSNSQTDAVTASANDMACALATARGKNAILRVGGGSFFDHAYRAVFLTWNSDPANENKYHLVGGGAGTVSAAGGWVASGGLSGTTGMRMYGIGIDQVLHLEMVLPSGTHVRFGPSAWTTPDDTMMMAPQTTAVTGYCNYAWDQPEENWEWTDCTGDDANIDFEELWFAVRGGGGGTWGIVTSLYYQVHGYPGSLTYTQTNATLIADYSEFATSESINAMTLLFVRFLLAFLYKPSMLNVTEAESRGCNSAKTVNLSPVADSTFLCYGTSGSKLVEKWVEYITAEDQTMALLAAGVPEDLIADLPQFIYVAFDAPSYAETTIFFAQSDPSWEFPGRIPDDPKASIIPFQDGFPYYVDSTNTHFPQSVLDEHFDELTEMIAEDVVTNGNRGIYATGGAIHYTSDGLDSLSPARRDAAFQMGVKNVTMRSRYYELFYGDADMTGPFPGVACHNHANIYEMGPLKNDWTKACPLALPQAERDAQCISPAESFWGTDNVARLEAFKQTIDPDGIFLCAAGIGWSLPGEAMEEPTDVSNPNEGSEDPASMAVKTAASTPVTILMMAVAAVFFVVV